MRSFGTITALLFLSTANTLFAQGGRPPSADSLEQVLASARTGIERIDALNELASVWRVVDLARCTDYANEALVLSRSAGYDRGEGKALNFLGLMAWRRDHLEQAIDTLRMAKAKAESIPDSLMVATIIGNLGLVYMELEDFPTAFEHFERQVRMSERLGDLENVRRAENNIGLLHRKAQHEEEAQIHLRRALAMSIEADDKRGIAITSANVATGLVDLGRLDTAEVYYRLALKLNKEVGNDRFVATNHVGLATLMQTKGDLRTALLHADTALAIRERMGEPMDLGQAHDVLASILLDMGDGPAALAHAEMAERLIGGGKSRRQHLQAIASLADALSSVGRDKEAVAWYKRYMAGSDSLQKQESAATLARQQVAFDVSRKDAQIKELALLKAKQRTLFIAIATGIMLLAIALWSRLRYMRRSRAAVQREKDRSDELLHNILPREVAAELRAKGSAEARSYDEATILFADLKEFTQVSERLSPVELVAELNECFRTFDGIMERHGVEKIKTIGDAYMAAGGVPMSDEGMVRGTVLAALEIQAFMTRRFDERTAAGLPAFQMRVGVHTGPVVAGIVGVKKFQYDIWGDTVNTASRMESSGEVGQVNISGATYARLKDEPGFTFTPRGKVQAKGKGELEMYFVHRSA